MKMQSPEVQISYLDWVLKGVLQSSAKWGVLLKLKKEDALLYLLIVVAVAGWREHV